MSQKLGAAVFVYLVHIVGGPHTLAVPLVAVYGVIARAIASALAKVFGKTLPKTDVHVLLLVY